MITNITRTKEKTRKLARVVYAAESEGSKSIVRIASKKGDGGFISKWQMANGKSDKQRKADAQQTKARVGAHRA